MNHITMELTKMQDWSLKINVNTWNAESMDKAPISLLHQQYAKVYNTIRMLNFSFRLLIKQLLNL